MLCSERNAPTPRIICVRGGFRNSNRQMFFWKKIDVKLNDIFSTFPPPSRLLLLTWVRSSVCVCVCVCVCACEWVWVCECVQKKQDVVTSYKLEEQGTGEDHQSGQEQALSAINDHTLPVGNEWIRQRYQTMFIPWITTVCWCPDVSDDDLIICTFVGS